MDWKPITTAPKDGTSVLLWFPNAKQQCRVARHVCVQHIENGIVVSARVYWAVEMFDIMGDLGSPTHWAPIVAPEFDRTEASEDTRAGPSDAFTSLVEAAAARLSKGFPHD